MLDESLVNIIRLQEPRPGPAAQARKWRRAVDTLDWLVTQIPRGARFQVYAFDVAARSAVAGSDGQWLDGSDPEVPRPGGRDHRPDRAGGRHLAQQRLRRRPGAQTAARQHPACDRRPADPGQPAAALGHGLAPAAPRALPRRHDELPSGVPVNVILLPMEGDPMAAPAFWQLAIATRGSFLVPSRDWP